MLPADQETAKAYYKYYHKGYTIEKSSSHITKRIVSNLHL